MLRARKRWHRRARPRQRSAAEVAQRARIVFLCLPDGPVVLHVARELADCPDRAVEIVVDSTTAGMPDARAAHDALAEARHPLRRCAGERWHQGLEGPVRSP